MNFMSYVTEVSRGWDEPNARDMGRMKSQPNAKGEMYILNDGIDMKVKIAAMARRLEELEMKKIQEVQAISQTPLQAMPCAICLSYEHLVDQCPTIPTLPQYKQPAQAPQQASNLEQAMMNLNKVMEDFVEAKKSINAQLSQRIDSVESSLNKKMDEVQNDLSQKIDNLQDSISREVKEVITLRSGKEVDLPTCKLEHKEESETEKEKREEIKEKRKGKSTEKDDYDLNIDEDPQRIVIKEEMKKHMPPLFLQALGMSKEVKEGSWESRGAQKHENSVPKPHSVGSFATAKPLFGTRVPFGSPYTHFAAAKWLRNPLCLKILQRAHHAAAPLLDTFQIRSLELQTVPDLEFETKKLWPFEDEPRKVEREFRSQSPISQGVSQLRNTPLAHECHFAAAQPHFVAAKWAAKMAPDCENDLLLPNDFQTSKWL
ncbi:hypothetical protein CK203_109731 [Vitis vinifera]|uniref:Uncharacterized protein n=1 Tax=Vitis vinifera TaxID=29760 RepID=A0A438BTA4_VITVI|nr:hypothetical protein CK203_109731 [Vitis vinifera]